MNLAGTDSLPVCSRSRRWHCCNGRESGVFEKPDAPQLDLETFGIGKGHMPILLATVSLDGQVRVGLEDTLRFDKTRLANSNCELVERATLIKIAGNELATLAEAREILGV